MLNEYQWYADKSLYALDKKMDDDRCRLKKAMSEWSVEMEKQVTADLIDDFIKELSSEMVTVGTPVLQSLSTLQRGMLTCIIGNRVHRYTQAVEVAMSKFNKI